MRVKLLPILLFICIITHAAPILTEKRIYLLDVTRSMEGKGNVPTPNIFDVVKNNLISAINHIEDENTEIVIIPFTNTTHTPIRFSIAQKDSVLPQIAKIELRKGDTNIMDAWIAGTMELDSTKVNYMFLLTDGLHNIGPSKEELVHTLQQWETLSRSKYFFSFYVMLTPYARELEICDIVDKAPQMYLIESLDINASLIRTALNQQSNIYENKHVDIAFISNNSNIFSNDLKLKFTLANNPYYSIKSAKMDSTSANIYHIEFQENTEKINIPVEITQTLYITHDKDSFPFVFFTPDNISYKIINQGLRKMTFKPAKQ